MKSIIYIGRGAKKVSELAKQFSTYTVCRTPDEFKKLLKNTSPEFIFLPTEKDSLACLRILQYNNNNTPSVNMYGNSTNILKEAMKIEDEINYYPLSSI